MSDMQWNPADNSLEPEPVHVENGSTGGNAPQQNRPLHHWWRWAIMAVALLSVGALVLAAVAWQQSHHKPAPTAVTINTQSLDNGTLTKLEKQSNNGTSKQLVVNADTTYKNNVSVNQGLQVNGPSTLQGSASISGNVAVKGSLSVGGQISAGSLNVGALNVSSITTSGNISFAGHLLPTGPTPTARIGDSAGGGSVSVSGSDTAGTVTITTGATVSSGELASITFSRAFGQTPKVQLTPVTGDSANLRYFVTRSAGVFSVESATAPAPRTSYVFDYQVSD